MDLNRILQLVDRQFIESHIRPLSATEILILKGIWQYQTYNQIAIKAGYSPGYFTTVVAPELYQRLSVLIGQRPNKRNCRLLLENYYADSTATASRHNQQAIATLSQNDRKKTTCYPSGSLPLDSPLYLERSSVEQQVYREIQKPGALIRIKAPKAMGKTSLLLRILDYAGSLGYRTVSLNLEQVDRAILSDLNQFLRWLCANCARLLQLPAKLDDYWDDDLGSKISSTCYFQDYLLESLDTPLVLALDELHLIFEQPHVAKDFLPLLRSWFEEAKRLPVWQKLRPIVVHSTEIYVPLQLNQSPFNVGLPIQLEDFNLKEVRNLAKRYGLDWVKGSQALQLMSMVGGHPALINIALYHLSREDITLSQLLETAPTAVGVYAHHLQRHWAVLQQQPELAKALNLVLDATEAIALDPMFTYKLSSMGLIKLNGNRATPSCQLYREYFVKRVD